MARSRGGEALARLPEQHSPLRRRPPVAVEGDDGREREQARTADDGRRGVRRGEVQGAGGSVWADFSRRASAPVHRRVRESLLSSDAVFKQVNRAIDLIFSWVFP
ncbi:hypothetical protein B296_00051353 [Ensete ventricosum]|uniref:Uncharacterized protein n=1 Tax=Ensete ventricosum TaxID=4639 RepID=A0A426XZV5_ENSVE|nr:hypothetical protein B296_00051353 [Ensete ventricosum]